MKVQQRPVVSAVTIDNKDHKQEPSSPKPAPDFFESSKSVKRDGLMLGALFAPIVLPHMAGVAASETVGGLGLLAGFGEFSEGIREANNREVVDGMIHMCVSGAIMASALASPVSSVLISSGGAALLGAKLLGDHPKDVADVILYQPIKLAQDAGKSILNLFTKK